MPSVHDILGAAALDAVRAPSPLNMQPWTWHLSDMALELRGDRDRRLTVIDPQGKLVLLSCGIALHHARVSLAAAGHPPSVERYATSFEAGSLARLSIDAAAAEPHAQDLREAIAVRRTDRRPFSDRPVSPELIDALVRAAVAEGAGLHIVREGQMPMLAVAVAQAGEVEMSDPAYREDLIRWTNRPDWSGDGVPAAATVQHVPRRVAMRELAIEPNEGMQVEPGGDRGAAYLIVHCEGDGPTDWFTAGEATSAVLLTATSFGLATAPISDVIEVAHPRDLVTGLLPAGRHPFVVIRCGWSDAGSPLPTVPRRDPAEVIIATTDS